MIKVQKKRGRKPGAKVIPWRITQIIQERDDDQLKQILSRYLYTRVTVYDMAKELTIDPRTFHSLINELNKKYPMPEYLVDMFGNKLTRRDNQ
jgi:hypothetical protein